MKLVNGVLTIKGQKEDDKVEKKEDFHLRERRFGSFTRSLRVPDTVDADKIEARFGKGVLTVTLPKTPRGPQADQEDRGQGRLIDPVARGTEQPAHRPTAANGGSGSRIREARADNPSLVSTVA